MNKLTDTIKKAIVETQERFNKGEENEGREGGILVKYAEYLRNSHKQDALADVFDKMLSDEAFLNYVAVEFIGFMLEGGGEIE